MKRRKSVLFMLIRRETHVRCPVRHNLLIMKLLMCQADARYRKIAELQSATPMSYECGRVFRDNYRTNSYVKLCYTPSVTVQLLKCSAREKIEDCLISNAPPANLPSDLTGCCAVMFALTADNWLSCYDLNTGKLYHRVFLSDTYSFKHLEWNYDEHSFVVKSTQCKRPVANGVPLPSGYSPPVVALAAFDVWPLRFTGLIEVYREVFGKDVINALLNQNCLVVLHASRYVRLYSMEHIISQGKCMESTLFEKLHNSDFVVGQPPKGLPSNIRIRVKPPLLFEVRCCSHDVNLGGLPWHYISQPVNARGQYHIKSLCSHQLARDGILSSTETSIEPDSCVFHDDDSGRIIHVGAGKVSVFKIVENDTPLPQYRVIQQFEINCSQSASCQAKEKYTSSGRLVRRNTSLTSEVDYSEDTVHGVSYEDDLDLLVITHVQPASDEDNYKAQVRLHDNQTGRLLKIIDLQEQWDSTCDHTVVVDLDTLIHITKQSGRGNSRCHIYRVDRT